ncbi:MAG: hypothetical protein HZA53_05750 [Planctomycetes bacterium]|nr:hypothetical protein [Planctomycetota bacterium]
MYSTIQTLLGRLLTLLLSLVGGFAIPSMLQAQCMNFSTDFYWANGLGGRPRAMFVHDDGTGPSLYVGGSFSESPRNHIARWNGTSWYGFGNGLGIVGGDEWVTSITAFDDGTGEKLYAGGHFTLSPMGFPVYYNLARWNGTSWSELPQGPASPQIEVHDILAWDDGTGPALYVVGNFSMFVATSSGGTAITAGIARWNGTAWYDVGGGMNGPVYCLEVWDDGSGPALYAGGGFSMAGSASAGGVARWSGSSWNPVGSGVDDIRALSFCLHDDGNGQALHALTFGSNSVVRWDGQSWSAIGPWPTSITSIWSLFSADLGNGPRLLAGVSSSPINIPPVWEWNGNAWVPNPIDLDGIVLTSAEFDDGHGSGPSLYLGGQFHRAGALVSRRIAAVSRCASPVDTMCVGDGTVAACPCYNQGARNSGCANSVSTAGARLTASGSPSNDTLALTTMNEPASAGTIVLQGTESVFGRVPFGDGLLCLGGRLVRLFTRTASSGSVVVPAGGDPTLRDRSAQRGDALIPGDVRYYQAYYRDVSATFCPAPSGGTFNVTNGVRVVW